jgi:hypothetical protein
VNEAFAAATVEIARAAMAPGLLDNPVFLSTVAGILGAAIAKGLDLLAARYKARTDVRRTDRELLSADEQAFRVTIIKELQQCKDEHRAKDRELARYQALNVRLIARLEYVEQQLRDLSKRAGLTYAEPPGFGEDDLGA